MVNLCWIQFLADDMYWNRDGVSSDIQEEYVFEGFAYWTYDGKVDFVLCDESSFGFCLFVFLPKADLVFGRRRFDGRD